MRKSPLRRIVIGVAVVVALAAPSLARAGGGPAWSAGPVAGNRDAPVVDGVVNDGEYADALPYTVKLGPYPATVRFVHANGVLYVGVTVQDLAPGQTPTLTAYFDNNDDGEHVLGDDAWSSLGGSASDDLYFDPQGANGANYYPDSNADRQNNTVAASTVTSGAVMFELSHPLCTDEQMDMCTEVGGKLGVDFKYSPGVAGAGGFNGPGTSELEPSNGWGDLSLSGVDVVPPTVSVTTPEAGATLSGTIQASADASDNVAVASVHFELFDGTNDTTYDLGTDDSAPFGESFDTTTVPDTAVGDATVYATATDTAGNTSTQVGNGVTIVNGGNGTSGGALDGNLTTPEILQRIDLTTAGNEDWATWGFANQGTSTSLKPDERKLGGLEIGDLALAPASPPAGVRAFGNDVANPFGFAWSDGTPDAQAAGAHVGLTDPANGYGVSFTVPADTTNRTLEIWTSAHWADGTLTARLSDDSAQPFSATLSGQGGQDTNLGENVPGLFTIHYNAASAGQHLTVTWTQTANNGCPGCDDVVLYAVALSSANPSHATGASAALETGASVGMSGSNDAIAALPLAAFEPAAPGVTPAPIQGLPIQGLPIQGLPIQGLPIQGLPIQGLPIQGLPIQGLPIQGLPIQGLPIQGLPLSEIPLTTAGGWAAALQGTTLANVPLQSVTLQQVLALPDPKPAAIRNLTLGNLDISSSRLGQLTIGALALGDTHVADLGLSASALASLVAWCHANVTGCTDATVPTHSLFALGIAGAPIQGLPIQGLPIQGLPIQGLPIQGLPIQGLGASASPIATLPIQGLPIQGLPLGGLSLSSLPASICTSGGACAGLTLADAQRLGLLSATATLGDLPDGVLTIGQLLQSLLAPGSPVADTMTLGDLIGMLVRRADVPWETLAPRLLSAFDPGRPQLHVTLDFAIQGTGSGAVQLKATVPDGFDPVPGSSSLHTGDSTTAVDDPQVDGNTLTWNVPSVSFGQGDHELLFSLWSGTDVGPAQVKASVAVGSVQAAASPASFGVSDSFQVIEGPPTQIDPDTRVEQSAIPSRGAVDYYRVALPAAGTRLLVHLTNLPADYDLALYADRTTSARVGAPSGTPLQDGIVPDDAINLQGGPNPQLTPSALQDVPNPGIPLVQVSDNRGDDDEDVGMVSPGGSGFATIAVYGYNGASSPHPYSLRVTTEAPKVENCGPRTYPAAGQGTTPDAVPATASLPSDLNTLILVDEKRLGDTYGSGGETTALTALRHLAGDRSLGVSGAVFPVDAVATAQYVQWDLNPCNNDAANAVANAIADEVAAVKAARPSLEYVVFAGGDDQIPFFRLPDVERIGNETGFASAFGRNEYHGALAAGDLLSDNPYLDTRPVPASGRQLFIPDLVGGRLVETPGEIAGAITRFETSNGTLARSSAFVSGYDFVTDGSKTIRDNLNGFLGTNATRTLITDTWSKSDLFNAAFPTGGPASINAWNGHYDNHQAIAANGDQSNLITTSDLTGPHALSGGVFFTMGCHAGFQTTDALVGGAVLDWAEYFAGTGTGFVGNTGFGLGNTDSVAFSEELMGDLAANLGGTLSMGEALARAKQTYYLAHVAYSAYDEKTMSEAELYGLPMYGIGHAPAPVGTPIPAPPTPTDPVSGTTSSTSPARGALSAFPGTSVQAAGFDLVPHFSAVQTGAHGNYVTNDGQVQAPNYRPLQPFVTLPATRSGVVAHGVVVDALASSDISPFDPDNVRPTVDLTANEPEPQFTDEAWPSKVPTLVTLNDANGLRQSVNLATGQFFTDSASHQGVEREWTHIGGRVTYSSSTDFVPPTVDAIDSFITNGTVTFSGRFSDLTETGATGTVSFAQVVYDADNAGTWRALQLQHDTTSGLWSAGTSFGGTQVQYFVEACDAAGNCGYSSNKGRYFDAQPLPQQSGSGITITPSRDPDTGTWYTGPLSASVVGDGAIASVDGGAFAPVTGPLAIAGDGSHVVDARGSDGSETTRVFLVDGRAPTITHSVSPAAPDGSAGWYVTAPTVSFTCADDVSGVATGGCAVDGSSPPSDHVKLGQSSSPQTVAATATDNAGNKAHDSVAGLKVDLADPSAPVFTGIQATIYPIDSLPASSAIGCTSTDAASGVKSCVVTGYSPLVGAHTLTATATDNAGRKSTSTLTYVVGFLVGDILPPVTSAKADQTNPGATDLRVFKIKSVVPLRFRLYLDSGKRIPFLLPPPLAYAVLTFQKASNATASSDPGQLLTDASPDSGTLFRWYVPDLTYVYNLKTKGLAAGTYYVALTLYNWNGKEVLAQSKNQYFILK